MAKYLLIFKMVVNDSDEIGPGHESSMEYEIECEPDKLTGIIEKKKDRLEKIQEEARAQTGNSNNSSISTSVSLTQVLPL